MTTEDGAKTASCTVTVEFTKEDNNNNNGNDNDNNNDNNNNNNNEDNTNSALPENGKTDDPNEAPKTDEPNNIWIWIIYLLVSLGVFAAVLIEGRKKIRTVIDRNKPNLC